MNDLHCIHMVEYYTAREVNQRHKTEGGLMQRVTTCIPVHTESTGKPVVWSQAGGYILAGEGEQC